MSLPDHNYHLKTQELLARIRKNKLAAELFDCVACSDTGRNSKGGLCDPCLVHKRVDRHGKMTNPK